MSLDTYRAEGGYAALRRAIELGPEGVIRELKDSGLVGRGGAAFPTGAKWEAVARQPARPHYLVCNADESEPGTFKDRVVMEGDPYTLIEAMTIAAYATGCEQGYIYLRGEYPRAHAILDQAIEHARDRGFLGAEVLGAGFHFDVEVRSGAGAYICGEETAIFNSIEGFRGEPRSKPPFPVTSGLFGKPTVVNNVETLVNVPQIVLEGGAAFASRRLRRLARHAALLPVRLRRAPGRLRGAVRAPRSASLLELAGGVRGGRPLQTILLGGAAGSFVGPDALDLPLTIEGARERGATLGSGVVMVFDDTVDVPRMLMRIAAFFRDESCGQCVPCRVGTVRQEEALARLLSGQTRGSVADELALLDEIGGCMKDASICGLGQTAYSAIGSAISPGGVLRMSQRTAQCARSSSRSTATRSRCPRARRSSTPAARRGVDTPTLCYGETLRPANVCRICVVEVEGARVLAPACSRVAEDGMKVRTDSERVRQSRKMVMEFLASSVDLSTAPEAQLYVKQYGAEPERYGPPAPPDPERDRKRAGHHEEPDGQTAATVHAPIKVDNELYVRDYSKCILCYKCVDACGEQYQNTFAITVAGRGFDARISTEFAVELPDSACVYCGNCIAVCPTGALMPTREHELREAGEWREEDQTVTRTICPYCGVGCNLELVVQDNEIVRVNSPRRPRRDARQPLHQGPLRLPARAPAKRGRRHRALARASCSRTSPPARPPPAGARRRPGPPRWRPLWWRWRRASPTPIRRAPAELRAEALRLAEVELHAYEPVLRAAVPTSGRPRCRRRRTRRWRSRAWRRRWRRWALRWRATARHR